MKIGAYIGDVLQLRADACRAQCQQPLGGGLSGLRADRLVAQVPTQIVRQRQRRWVACLPGRGRRALATMLSRSPRRRRTARAGVNERRCAKSGEVRAAETDRRGASVSTTARIRSSRDCVGLAVG